VRQKYEVSPDEGQRAELEQVVGSGVWPVRKVTHARVLLRAGAGEADAEVAEAVEVAAATVGRVRKRSAREGLGGGLGPQAPAAAAAGRTGGRTEVRRGGRVRDGPAGAYRNKTKPWPKERWCVPPEHNA
jgi:hypothetical protein